MPNKKKQQINIQDNYDEHYTMFCNNVNEAIKKEIGLYINSNNNNIHNDWKPPKSYGLGNSDPIIPSHYINKNNPFQEIDLFYELTRDIRNLKPLCKSQLDYIKTLNKEEVLQLIEIYNDCLYAVTNMLERI